MARTDWVDGQDVDAPSMNSLGAEVNGKQTNLPSQTGHAGESLHTNGLNLLWSPDTGGGGGATNLTTTRTSTQVVVASDTGTDATLLAADTTNAGLMTAADRVKFATIATNADVTNTTTVTAAGAVMTSTKNVAGGVAGLDGSGQVAAAQLPSYVDDVVEYANLAAFPVTGETGKIYVALNTSLQYRWSGSIYTTIVSSPGSTDAVTEGTTNLYYTNARVAAAPAVTAKLDTSAAPELIRDTMGTALIAGTNITITPNDVADTITISSAAGTGYTPGGTDVAITDGGTGVSTLPSGLLKGAGTAPITAAVVGIDYQGANANLTAIAGQTLSANQVIYATGAGAVAQTPLSAFARTFLDDADAAAVRSTLGVGSGGGDASTNTVTSVDGEGVQFSGTAGKTLKRSTLTGLVKQTSGVESAAIAGTDYVTPAGAETLINKTLTTPVINGLPTGTGVSSASTASTLAARDTNANIVAGNLFESFATTVTAAGITTLTVASAKVQEATGTTTQTFRLPTTGVPQGAEWIGVNNSTGVVTWQSSGANTVLAMGAGTRAVFTSKVANPTTAANWTASITGGTYQAPITLTTTGTSGAATFTGNVLNVPQYTGGGGGGTDVPSGWADVTKSPYNANNNYPTNSASSGNAIRAAAASGLPVWIPAGSYLFDGAGISQDDLYIMGPGPGQARIVLGAGAYFIDGANAVNTLKLSGILFEGGAGIFRSTYNDVAVVGYRIFENCQFHDYTATAIGHRHTDSPYWVFRDCEFRGANDTTTIGVALNGLNDDNLFHHCTFEWNRIHIKLKEGANAHISGGCSFFRWQAYTANPRIDIWLVPRTQAEIVIAEGNFADAGSGFSIQETKFGNEWLDPLDYRVVIADALAGNFETALPQLAANSDSVWIGGMFTNFHNSLIGGTCPPFIYSTTPNLYAVSAGNFAHIGSDSLAAARVLQLRTATGFEPTINAIGPVMTGADSLFGQVLVAATTGTLTGQPPYMGAGGGSGGALDPDLTAIAALTSAANQLPYATGTNTWAMTTLSAFGRTLIDDADAAAMRSTLGVGTGGGDASTNTATSVDSEVALFSGTSGKTLKRATGSGIPKLTAGVQSIATPGTDYHQPGGTDIPVADGGTGASTLAANAVLLGNGTSALQTVAPSTSGNVLTSNGTTWSSAAPPTGTLPSQTGQSGKYLTTNGTAASWGTVSGGSANVVELPAPNGTDDTSVIQAAINASAVGDTIVFRVGTYLITAPLVFKPGRAYVGRGYHLHFTGGAAVIKQKNAANIANGANPSGLIVAEAWNTNATVCDPPMRIYNLQIDGNRDNNTGTACGIVGVSFYLHVDDCWIHSTPLHGVLLTNATKNGVAVTNSCTDNVIQHNRFEDITGYAVRAIEVAGGVSANQDVYCIQNNIRTCGQGGMLIDRVAGWTIRDNHLSNIDRDAIVGYQGFATHIVDNYVEDFGVAAVAATTHFGIYLRQGNTWGSTVTGNFVSSQEGATGGEYDYLTIIAGSGSTDAHAVCANNILYGPDTGPTAKGYGLIFDNGSGGTLNVRSSNNHVNFVNTPLYLGASIILNSDEAQSPIRFNWQTATVGATATDYAYAPRTLMGARMRVVGAPSGSALTVQVQHSSNAGSTWSSVGSALSIASGSVTEASVAFTQKQSQGHLVRCNVTSVGSTTAATGVVVDVLWCPF